MTDENKKSKSVSNARRHFLHVCLGGMGTAAAGIVSYPLATFLKLPQKIGGATKIELTLTDLSEDQAHYFDRDGIQIVLVYTRKEPKVFDAACPHLGCLVAWDQNKHIFHCPCHGAVFDDEGEVVSGPVNSPLKRIKFSIEEEKIVIS